MGWVSILIACGEGGRNFDGIPGEWTFPVFASRFLVSQSLAGRPFYEPIPDPQGVRVAAAGMLALAYGGVEPADIPGLGVAMDMFSGCYSAPEGRLELPDDTERLVGTHFVALDGILADDEERLRFQNSWGDWGDAEGAGSVPLAYLVEHMREAWILRQGHLGPRPEAYIIGSSSRKIARSWRRPTEEEDLFIDGLGATKRRLVAFLPPHEDCVQLILRHPDLNLPIAWAHLRFRQDTCYFEEFFVPPAVRGNGLGSRLLQWCKGEAMSRGFRSSVLLQLEADAVRAEVSGAPTFASWTGHNREGSSGAVALPIGGSEVLSPRGDGKPLPRK